MTELDFPLLMMLRKLQVELPAWDSCVVVARAGKSIGCVYSDRKTGLPDMPLVKTPDEEVSVLALMHVPGREPTPERIADLVTGLLSARGVPSDAKDCLPADVLGELRAAANFCAEDIHMRVPDRGRQLTPRGGLRQGYERFTKLSSESTEFFSWARRTIAEQYPGPMIVSASLDYTYHEDGPRWIVKKSGVRVSQGLDRPVPDGVDVFDDLVEAIVRSLKVSRSFRLASRSLGELFADTVNSMNGIMASPNMQSWAPYEIRPSWQFDLTSMAKRLDADLVDIANSDRIGQQIKVLLRPSFELNPEMKRFWTDYQCTGI